MAPVLMVCGQEMQVVAGHVQGLRVLRGPKPTQCSQDIVKLKLRLHGGRLDEGHSFLGPAHHARSDITEMSFHAQGEEEVIGMPELIELGEQMAEARTALDDDRWIRCEASDHRERDENMILQKLPKAD
jgi:hypothetical protein